MTSQSEYAQWLSEVLIVPNRDTRRSIGFYTHQVNLFAEALANQNAGVESIAAGFLGEATFVQLLKFFSPEETEITLTIHDLDRIGCDLTVRQEKKTIGGFDVTLSPKREREKIDSSGLIYLVPLPMRGENAEQVSFPTAIIRPQLHIGELVNNLESGNMVKFSDFVKALVQDPDVLTSINTGLEKIQTELDLLKEYAEFTNYIMGVRQRISEQLEKLSPQS